MNRQRREILDIKGSKIIYNKNKIKYEQLLEIFFTGMILSMMVVNMAIEVLTIQQEFI
jgi:hypothetical protein